MNVERVCASGSLCDRHPQLIFLHIQTCSGGFLGFLLSAKEGAPNILLTTVNLSEHRALLIEVDLPTYPTLSDYQVALDNFSSQPSQVASVAEVSESLSPDWTTLGTDSLVGTLYSVGSALILFVTPRALSLLTFVTTPPTTTTASSSVISNKRRVHRAPAAQKIKWEGRRTVEKRRTPGRILSALGNMVPLTLTALFLAGLHNASSSQICTRSQQSRKYDAYSS
ncbi:hypothetical protein LguiB_005511 [Lonicera macranthoides]